MVGSVRSNTLRSYYIKCRHGAARVRPTSSCTCYRCTLRKKTEAIQGRQRTLLSLKHKKKKKKGQAPLFSSFRSTTREIAALRGRACTAVYFDEEARTKAWVLGMEEKPRKGVEPPIVVIVSAPRLYLLRVNPQQGKHAAGWLVQVARKGRREQEFAM